MMRWIIRRSINRKTWNLSYIYHAFHQNFLQCFLKGTYMHNGVFTHIKHNCYNQAQPLEFELWRESTVADDNGLRPMFSLKMSNG